MKIHQHDGRPWFDSPDQQLYSRSMHTEYEDGVALRVTVDGDGWAYFSICDSGEGTPERWATVMYGRPNELRKSLLAHARFLDVFDSDNAQGETNE